MRDFNKAIIMGNLTRDPEMRYTPNGQPVCSFGVATNRRWNDAAGETKESTEFHDVVAWGKLAEICSQILYKGRKVLIEGRLQTRSWEGQDGVKRNKTEIVAENISAIGPSAAGAGSVAESGAGAKPAAGKTHAEPDLDEVIDGVEEKESAKTDKSTKAKKESDKSDQKKTTGQEDKINLDDIPF